MRTALCHSSLDSVAQSVMLHMPLAVRGAVGKWPGAATMTLARQLLQSACGQRGWCATVALESADVNNALGADAGL